MNDVSNDKFWNQCYIDSNTGWDIGKVTPVFKHWADNLEKKSKILVPGAGNGYDPLYFSSIGHDVTAVDFSKEAVNKMKSVAKKDKLNLDIIQRDFFDLIDEYKNKFDYVVEYTFYCAIDPQNRDKYIDTMHSLLNDNGFLVGLFLPLKKDISESGPPFAVREKEIEERFSKKFDLFDSYMHSLSIDARKENEKYFIFKKK
tara:strand:- start:6038 stop:6640 length:603 start_codon:yes stop_codon:yes gene_type:complete